jgi:PhnB protein
MGIPRAKAAWANWNVLNDDVGSSWYLKTFGFSHHNDKNRNIKHMSNGNNEQMVQSYLYFEGRCEEALDFYRRAIGAEVVSLFRYKDSPQPPPPGQLPPNWENKVMHASFRIGQTTLLGSDGCSTEKPKFEGFSLSLTVLTAAEADKAFAALAEGGQVRMPLAKTFFSERFGMLQDRFGLGWMVLVRPNG